MLTRLKLLGILAAACVGLAFQSRASTDFNGLKIEMDGIAAKITTTMKEEKQTAVAIRDFTAPASMQANFGLALKDTPGGRAEDQRHSRGRRGEI